MKRTILARKFYATFIAVLVILCLCLTIPFFAAADTPDEVTFTKPVQQQSSSNSTSNGSSLICYVFCCSIGFIILAAIALIIVVVIVAVSKMNKREEKIKQMTQSAQQAPPAIPTGAPVPATAGPKTWAQQIFVGDTFRVDMKILHFGYSYYIYDAWNRPIGYTFMKPLKLKEDIRVFTDDSRQYEIMSIQQEQLLDLTGKFQVWDTQSKQFLGLLQRQFLKSFIADEWNILNFNRQQVGVIKEDSIALALVRRYMKFGGWIPNASFINYQGRDLGVIKEKFRIIGNEYYIHLVPGSEVSLDRRLAIACVLMMAMFETKKNR